MAGGADSERKGAAEKAAPPPVAAAANPPAASIVNPHIPHYIVQAPWYLGGANPRSTASGTANPTGAANAPGAANASADAVAAPAQEEDGSGVDRGEGSEPVSSTATILTWHKHGVDPTAPAPTKFKKGACKNCGSTTHTAVTCIERPRRRGAVFSNENLGQIETLPETGAAGEGLNFQAKRDRWGGHQAPTVEALQEEHELKLAALRRREQLGARKAKRLKVGEDALEEGENKLKPGATGATACGSLRIREDTAKYLINLDVNSAFYDPKTRSMRQDPTLALPEDRKEKIDFRGENIARESGDVPAAREMQIFAWRREQDLLRAAQAPTALVAGTIGSTNAMIAPPSASAPRLGDILPPPSTFAKSSQTARRGNGPQNPASGTARTAETVGKATPLVEAATQGALELQRSKDEKKRRELLLLEKYGPQAQPRRPKDAG